VKKRKRLVKSVEFSLDEGRSLVISLSSSVGLDRIVIEKDILVSNSAIRKGSPVRVISGSQILKPPQPWKIISKEASGASSIGMSYSDIEKISGFGRR